MNLGLAARLGLVFAALVATTTLVASAAGVVSTNAQVRNDVDRFLRDRADEIVDGTRSDENDRRNQSDRGRDSDGRSRDRNSDGDDDDSDGGGGSDGSDGSDGDDDSLSVDEVTRSLTDADAEVQIINRQGEVDFRLNLALPVEATDLRLITRPGSELRTITIGDVDYRMITQHLPDVGVVQIATGLGDTNNLLSAIRTRSLIIGLAMSAVAGAVGWALARRQTRPLSLLTESVERVATTQDLSTSIHIDRSDEIGRLASSFERMLQALARSRDQQHQLVQDAAHELRTPLTSISANVDLLTRAEDLDPELRRTMLGGIRSELGQLNRLFTEIIELATDARDTPSYDQIDLAEVAQSAISGFANRSNRTVKTDLEPSPVVGDPTSLERAVTNLLSNAEKYSPDDSTISVTVSAGTLTVRDYGPGIPAEEIDRVFDRFYRSEAARSQPGSGLGLAIVDKIVTDHGGQPFIRPAAGGPESTGAGSGSTGAGSAGASSGSGTEAGFSLPTTSDNNASR